MKKCPVCGKDANSFYQKNKLIVFKCESCGLGFTEGAEIQEGDYHRAEAYIAGKKLFTNIYQKRVNLINKLKVPKGKVLEIGSSSGLMLSLLSQNGWEAMGIELSPKSADYARQNGIPTLNAKFEDVHLPKKSFDLIILNHTLEHMENPAEVLKKARGLLTDSGYLFIDVPNFGGLSAKIYGSRWPYLLPREHLWHFTQESIKRILLDQGFRPVYFEMSSGVWDLSNPALELWQSLTGFKKRFFANFLTFLPTLIISRLNLGSGMIVISGKATKK